MYYVKRTSGENTKIIIEQNILAVAYVYHLKTYLLYRKPARNTKELPTKIRYSIKVTNIMYY